MSLDLVQEADACVRVVLYCKILHHHHSLDSLTCSNPHCIMSDPTSLTNHLYRILLLWYEKMPTQHFHHLAYSVQDANPLMQQQQPSVVRFPVVN